MSVNYVGDSSASLTKSILGMVEQSGLVAQLSGVNRGTSPQVPYYSRPVTYAASPTSMSGSSIFLGILLVVGAFFAFKKL